MFIKHITLCIGSLMVEWMLVSLNLSNIIVYNGLTQYIAISQLVIPNFKHHKNNLKIALNR